MRHKLRDLHAPGQPDSQTFHDDLPGLLRFDDAAQPDTLSRNIWETVLVLSCVPLALVGGVLGLKLNGLPFSVSAGVGFVALMGIAVLNGVVLLNVFNDLREQGISGVPLLQEGTRLRLRPVLMTALVDVFGFLPMMLATGVGAEVQRPLASVVIGGVVSSTLLTLVVLPVLVSLLENKIWRKGSS